jgi:SAM-dependent methyltransferase
MIERFALDSRSHVVEVASNDGYLLQYFKQRRIRVTGIEPAANCAEASRAKGIPTEVLFFSTCTACDLAGRHGRADLIAANNVLAHVPDIHDFTGGFRELLKPEGVATFEFPHLMNLIGLNQFDTIYHEHFSYLALGPVQRVFSEQGLRIFDVQELSTHGGSLRVFACLDTASHASCQAVTELLDRERVAGLTALACYDDFRQRVVEIKNSLLEFLIEAKRRGRTVAAYGAAAKGNTLLNYCGAGKEYIEFVVDKNPIKQNTLLPGSRIPVFRVEEVYARKPDYLLILPWNLREEITGQMTRIREWGGRFVAAIPKLEVF